MNKIFIDKKFLEIFILGMISGMPLSLIYTTLGAWLTEEHIGIEIITTFAVARIPYSLKFLWAPLVDYIKIPFLYNLGHRKSWMIFCYICITIIVYIMCYIKLLDSLTNLYILTIILGICSATYDINFDAFRIEKFTMELQCKAAAISVMGYRVGMLITSAGVLEISYLLNSWPDTFKILSIIFFISTIYIFTIKEELKIKNYINKLSLNLFFSFIVMPFKDFLLRKGAILILAVIILFKMGDAMLGAVIMPFYLELGYTKHQIAIVAKVWGLIPNLIGSYMGGVIMSRFNPTTGLIITGIIQSLTHIPFIWIYYQNTSYNPLFIAISIENFGVGIGTSAIFGYLSILCNKKYSASQYALLSSFTSLFHNTITIYAGQLVKNMGWIHYFLFTMTLSLPALMLLFYMRIKFKNDNINIQ